MADYDGAYINATKALVGIDLTTVVGLTCGFTMICTAIFLGCSLESFINPSAILIVMGAASIGNTEIPRRLEMPLNSAMPLNKRIRYVE